MTKELQIINDDDYNAISQIDYIADAMNRISESNKRRRQEKTNPESVKVRQGKAGRSYFYINRLSAIQWLDKHFPLWEMRILPNSLHVLEDVVEGGASTGSYNLIVEITVKDPETGIPRVIQSYGQKEFVLNRDKEITLQQYLKAAETDALKRCVFTLGGFADVYAPEDELEEISDIDVLVRGIKEILPAAIKAFEMHSIKENDLRVILSKMANLRLENEDIDKWLKILNKEQK